MAENTIQLGPGCRRHRHADAGRPDRSANMMNEHYAESHASRRRTPRRREGFDHRRGDHQREEDVLRRRGPEGHDPGHPRGRGRVLQHSRGDQGGPAHARDPRQAGGRRHQRRRARRRPRDRAGVSPPRRRRREGTCRRLPRGDPGSAARRWWCHPHGAHVRHPERVHEGAVAGHPVQAGAGQGDRAHRRGRADGRGAGARRQGVDQGQPRRAHPAVGRQGLQDARRHAEQPRARGDPAVVPREAAQAAQGRADAGAAGDPGRRGRGAQVDFDTASRIESRYFTSWSPARSRRT